MKKVAVIGAAIVDVLLSPAEEDLLSRPRATADIVMSHGGDALNEATVLSALGVPVVLNTLLGRDDAGRSVLAYMEKQGLSTEGVRICDGIPTSVNLVLVKPDGERSFVTNPHGSQRLLSPEHLSHPLDDDIGILSFASIFVFPLFKTGELETLFRQAKAQGITVCADMTKRKNGETLEDLSPALRHVDYLFPNAEEAILLTGEKSVEDAAEALFRAGVGTVVIKCGADGCYVRNADGAFRHAAEKAERCIDTTGAGDSFVGGFICGLAEERPPEDCLRLALRCGARAVEKLGATAWTAEGAMAAKQFL